MSMAPKISAPMKRCAPSSAAAAADSRAKLDRNSKGV
jgi:hypothetical protein